MNPIQNPTDIREIDKKINLLCSKVLVRHTCQFFTNENNEGMQPFGSGVFVKSSEKHFIITASHVSEYMEEDDKELHIKINHNKYVNVIGEVLQTEIELSENIDLAVITLDAKLILDLSKPYLFLPISKFRKHDKLIKAPHYCVLGYPAVNKRIVNGLRETGATIYLTRPSNEKVYRHYKYDPKNFYALKMEGKGSDIKTGERTKINDKFHGISGCGLWLMLPHFNGKEYDVDYRLIGIMTEFRKSKYYCLVGNKIQLVVDALNAIEKLKIQPVNNK